jgi:hypothetical protein
MQEFLKEHGIKAAVKYIARGSLAPSWRIYNHDIKWTEELAAQFTELGFTGLHGPIGKYEGNGGVLSVFLRGHFDFLDNAYQPKTGLHCHCRPGVYRDNCPNCEGTGWQIDFAKIRARNGIA